MKSNQNFLIIGAGKIGTTRAQVIRKLSQKTRILIFDKDFKRAKELAKLVNGKAISSIDMALKDKSTQAVVVSVTNKYAKDICIKALKNKKHVLCEKPMGKNYKEAKEIFNAVEKHKCIFKCGFNHRYHPAIKEAYRLVKERAIGQVLYIRAVYGHGGRKGYANEWRAKKSLSGGGELLDQGSHLIDLCSWFFKFEEIKRIFCIAQRKNKNNKRLLR